MHVSVRVRVGVMFAYEGEEALDHEHDKRQW